MGSDCDSSEALIATSVIVMYVKCRRYEGHPDQTLVHNRCGKSGGIGTAFTRQCKFCGDLITLVLLTNGRWQAQNLDNTLHQCAIGADSKHTLDSGAMRHASS